jgi:hypothetical protein
MIRLRWGNNSDWRVVQEVTAGNLGHSPVWGLAEVRLSRESRELRRARYQVQSLRSRVFG